VDGMLVNQRSHAHGQGWTDLNFLIPELATGMEYRKGPYFAAEGDFASAGAASIKYADSLARGIASVALGQNGFKRVLLADSPKAGAGNVLYALEAMQNDGPFVNSDKFRKLNGVLRYSEGDALNGFNVTAMAYQARWNATDQIPKRAVDAGLLNRFDAIDTTDGGSSHRYSLSAAWRRSGEASGTQVNGYLIDNRLDLFSNFTYALDDEIRGDQFAQPDRRRTFGLNATHAWALKGVGMESENSVGLQFQTDNIFNGLLSTQARQTVATTRSDHIVQSSLGVFVENATRWTPWFRTVAGLRPDGYRFKVGGDNAANSGKVNATIVNPKLGLIFGPLFGPVAKTDFYVNAGGGFHSNDARGTTIRVDPKSGEAVDPVTALVRSRGAELGLRTVLIPGLQTSLSLYRLDFGSELLFVGDAGTTEAGRPSRRTGFELANLYKLSDWLTVDADMAFARARFRDADAAGQRIPGAVEGVASLAIAVDNVGPWFGALQWRYFGPRPLIEDNSVRSSSTALFNGRIGYKVNAQNSVELEGFNLGNKRASAIDYYYASRLPGEASGGSDDVHFHPTESRSFRLTWIHNF
jgi:catechol 2,3-dioxygenase-like lactoylglutathione lyase family enzyme